MHVLRLSVSREDWWHHCWCRLYASRLHPDAGGKLFVHACRFRERLFQCFLQGFTANRGSNGMDISRVADSVWTNISQKILRATHKIAEHSVIKHSTNKVDPFLILAAILTFLNCALRINM